MDTRVALIGIIVENMDSTPELNKLLHEYGSYIIGRMGLPYRERNVHHQRCNRCAAGCYQCTFRENRQT